MTNALLVQAAQPAIPWYRSQVMIGAVTTIVSSLVVVVPKLAAALGLTSPDAISTSVNALFEMLALGSGIWTAVARQNSSIQPVTLTQAAADVHPATLIAARVATADVPIPFHPVPNDQLWSIDMANPGQKPKPSQPQNPNPPPPPTEPFT